MALVDWAASSPPWLGSDAPAGSLESRVLFTRFVRRRNFKGFAFWVSCPPETCAAVAARARAYAQENGFSPMTLADYAPEAIEFFRERQWLPERPFSFPGKREFKMLCLESDPTEHALVGEIEHWTQIRVRPGLSDTMASPALNDRGVFSHSESHGFLTSHPSFCGVGLQLECGLHLPALTALRRATQVQKALNAMGFELLPLSLRIPGTADAGFYRIITRGGMLFSEEKFQQRFAEKIRCVLAVELKALKKWEERDGNLLEDRVHRSVRLLQEARSLPYSEYLAFSSFARVGAYQGLFPAHLTRRLEDLRVRTLPGHAFALLKTRVMPQEEDIFRANMVRSGLEGVGLGG